ncbi:glycosyl hydrolase family 28-related protein [Gordonia sp. NPDC003425]
MLSIPILAGCAEEPVPQGSPALGPTETVTATMSYPRLAPQAAADVTKFGAQGNNRNDDTDAIQAALDDVPASGGIVFFPAGRYRVSRDLTARNTTTLMGVRGLDGSGSRIEVGGNGSAALTLEGNASVLDSIEVGYASTGRAINRIGVRLRGWFSQVRYSRIRGFDVGLEVGAGYYSVLDSSFREFGTAGIRVNIPSTRGDAGDGSITGNTIERNKARDLGGAGIRWESGGGMRLVNNKINGERSMSAGVLIRPVSGVETGVLLISDNSIENFLGSGVSVSDDVRGITNGVVIANNQIAGRVGGRASVGIEVHSELSGLAVTGNSIMYVDTGIALNLVRTGTVAGNVLSDIADTDLAIGGDVGDIKIPS